MAEEKFDFAFKICVVGDTGVGKSNLVLRFLENTFSETPVTTVGEDYKTKIVDCDGKRVKLKVWDTAGQEKFRGIYYRGASGVIVVFDVCDQISFSNVKNWVSDIDTYAVGNSEADKVPKLIVANKIDLTTQRVIDTASGKEMADSLRVPYIEASAKTNQNVAEVFMSLASAITKKQMANAPAPKSSNIRLGEPKPSDTKEKKKKGGCTLL